MPTIPSQDSPDSHRPHIDRELQYKVAFDTWRFQVDSYWQRNSYFAAFQSVALAGAWKLQGQRLAIALCYAGALLAVIWLFNNLKTHSYVRYWWQAIGDIEQKLARSDSQQEMVHFVWDYEMKNRQFWINRFRWFQYGTIINSIPLLFFGAWVCMAVLSTRAIEPNGTVRTDTDEYPSEGLVGFSRFAVPNNFFSPGIVFGVDPEGNSYVLADLTKETPLELLRFSGPRILAELSGTFRGDEITKIIGQNMRGDLVSRVLEAARYGSEKQGQPLGETIIQMQNTEHQMVRATDVLTSFRNTPFWKERRKDFENLRLFVVVETVGVRQARFSFPSANEQVVRAAAKQLQEVGEILEVVNDRTIEVTSPSQIGVGFKAAEITDSGLAFMGTGMSLPESAQPFGVLKPVRFALGSGRTNSPSPNEIPTPKVVPLSSTHFAEAPRLASYPRNATYGNILEQIETRLMGSKGAGFNEVRFFDSGTGFAIATPFEVTDQNGIPLVGDARFLPRASTAKGMKLRGFYITVSANPKPNAFVSSTKPEAFFCMKYGMPYLPDDMKRVRIDASTSVKVFVVEFENGSGRLKKLDPTDCAKSAETHMVQSRILE